MQNHSEFGQVIFLNFFIFWLFLFGNWEWHIMSFPFIEQIINWLIEWVWHLCPTLSPPEPCQPADLTVEGSCYNETVVLDWSSAKGAFIYEVTATGDLGYITSFQTNDTMLEAELPCGQMFTFTVKAKDNQCDSAESDPKEFKTGMGLLLFCLMWHVRRILSWLSIHPLSRPLCAPACTELYTLWGQSGLR